MSGAELALVAGATGDTGSGVASLRAAARRLPAGDARLSAGIADLTTDGVKG